MIDDNNTTSWDAIEKGGFRLERSEEEDQQQQEEGQNKVISYVLDCPYLTSNNVWKLNFKDIVNLCSLLTMALEYETIE